MSNNHIRSDYAKQQKVKKQFLHLYCNSNKKGFLTGNKIADGNSGEFFLHTFGEQISYKNISRFSISGRNYKLEFSTLLPYSILQRIFYH